MEKWISIENTNDMIQVSNMGRVRSNLRENGKILKCTPDSKGYLRLRVTINRKKMSFKLHREVAKAFIPNPNDYPQVNHINGNKKDNRVENLEWCTNQQNIIHAYKNKLMKSNNPNPKKPVIGYFENKTKLFESVSEAEKYLNSRHISDVLKGKRKRVKGWTFSYLEGGDALCQH